MKLQRWSHPGDDEYRAYEDDDGFWVDGHDAGELESTVTLLRGALEDIEDRADASEDGCETACAEIRAIARKALANKETK